MTDNTNSEMDPNGLFREENFTDQKMGAIRKLTPVTADGSDDNSRETLFFGSAQVMTPMGAIPLNFALDGTTVGEAASDFADKAAIAVKKLPKNWKRCGVTRLPKLLYPVKAAEWADHLKVASLPNNCQSTLTLFGHHKVIAQMKI